jgi:hypothetical protein
MAYGQLGQGKKEKTCWGISKKEKLHTRDPSGNMAYGQLGQGKKEKTCWGISKKEKLHKQWETLFHIYQGKEPAWYRQLATVQERARLV